MNKVLGIVNFEDATASVEGLGDHRPVSAFAFLGRYRVIDFVLSNMTNSGINDIQVYCKEKPRSLIEHLGTGQQYNINSKRGNLHILNGEKKPVSDVYNHDVNNFMQNMEFIEESDKGYVVVAPSYFIYQIDYNQVIEAHINSGDDITILYKATDNAKNEFIGCETVLFDETKKVIGIEKNRGKYKTRNISLECYVMSRKLFIDLVNRAANTSSLYWFKDILRDVYNEYTIRGYAVKGYVACINTLKAYFKANMDLRKREIARNVFKKDWPIHTMTNDSCPTQYVSGSVVKGSTVANGCLIEGTVINSVLGRNVTVKKGAVVENSIILPGAYISDGAKLDHVVVDKYAIIHHVKKLEGTDDSPVYVKRRDRI